VWLFFKGFSMARPSAPDLTERELEVMQAAWKRGDCTVSDVREELASSGRELAYTTVATLMKILTDKGCLSQITQERPFVYRPIRTYDDVSRSMLGDLVERLFGGSREKLLSHLLGGKKLSAKERALLEAHLRETDK
jgi:BlaI family penicillinase repressor